MVKLYYDLAPYPVYLLYQPFQAIYVFIFVDTEHTVIDPPCGVNAGIFYGNVAYAPFGPCTVVGDNFWRDGPFLIAQVGLHGRHDNAVLYRHGTYLEGAEEIWKMRHL